MNTSKPSEQALLSEGTDLQRLDHASKQSAHNDSKHIHAITGKKKCCSNEQLTCMQRTFHDVCAHAIRPKPH